MPTKTYSIGEYKNNFYRHLEINAKRIRYRALKKVGKHLRFWSYSIYTLKYNSQKLKLPGQKWTIQGVQQATYLICVLKEMQQSANFNIRVN